MSDAEDEEIAAKFDAASRVKFADKYVVVEAFTE
jgi:hypothetical protein